MTFYFFFFSERIFIISYLFIYLFVIILLFIIFANLILEKLFIIFLFFFNWNFESRLFYLENLWFRNFVTWKLSSEAFFIFFFSLFLLLIIISFFFSPSSERNQHFCLLFYENQMTNVNIYQEHKKRSFFKCLFTLLLLN